MSTGDRVFVLWAPDWPVQAFLAEHASETPAPTHVALVAARRIVACSEDARAQGVRPGMREREALSQCPELVLHPHSPEVDERRFAPVLAAVEAVTPGIDPLRPGLCALRGRGPTRYYGSEEAAAKAILAAASSAGVMHARIGIADGVFAAQQAARAHSQAPEVRAPHASIRIVTPGKSADFVKPLPVAHAADDHLAGLLHGLGITTLGDLAALPEAAVRQRFGPAGVAAHLKARATAPPSEPGVQPRQPVRELAVEIAFEPPLATTDQLTFACAQLAESFVTSLTRERLVCTALRIELVDDLGLRGERLWAHPQHFTAPDIINRIRWQADAAPGSVSHGATGATTASHPADSGAERGGAGISLVRLIPARTEPVSSHEPTLWSSEPDQRVHHRFSQVQSKLGHTGVGTLVLGGGRLLHDRQDFVVWGNRPEKTQAPGPWPGALPAPRPSRVFTQRPRVLLTDSAGAQITVDPDDMLTADPVTARVDLAAPQQVTGWSPVWPVRERWWEGQPARFRMQLLLADGTAWLMLCENGAWYAEGKYD